MKVGLVCLLGFICWATGEASIAASKYYGEELCAYPQFKCVSVEKGDTWAKLFPNERDRDIVKRLNRTNMKLSSRPWIVVPENLQDIEYMDLSPFPSTIEPDKKAKPQIIVDLSLHGFAAYDAEGYLVHWGPISGGKDWCSDVGKPCNTAMGSHRILRKQGAGCVSSKYPIKTNGGAPMPYCMHYYRGYAIHGANLPGYHASHGCVRLFYDDAKWLNQEFIEIGTPVTVIQSQSSSIQLPS